MLAPVRRIRKSVLPGSAQDLGLGGPPTVVGLWMQVWFRHGNFSWGGLAAERAFNQGLYTGSCKEVPHMAGTVSHQAQVV